MNMIIEHYYTCRGRQRAVFLRPEAGTVKFVLEAGVEDEAAVEVTYDPPEVVRRGQGLWEAFDGGVAGSVSGATALRVNIGKVEGWVRLTVKT